MSRPGPDRVVALPFSTIYGMEPSEYEQWGLIDPTEDDPAIVECANQDIAEYVAGLWNADHDKGDDGAEFRVRKNAPDTSHAIVSKMREGTLQHDVLMLFINLAVAGGGGATDDDIEAALGRSHQSVSGARNTLVRKGYLEDSGLRRPNRYGNMAIRWSYTGKRVER
jgi:hypothetical protein